MPKPRHKNYVGTTIKGEAVRSSLELKIANSLHKRGVAYTYEMGLVVTYAIPMSVHRYTPDFQVIGHKWVVEGKGLLDSATRVKMLHVKASNPDLDIRFVFQRDNPIYKGSKVRYSQWATKHGFKWAIGDIPQAWIDEESK